MKKIVSLALCLAMIFFILPMGSLKLYADVVEPEIIWLEKDYGQVGIFSESLAEVVVGSPYNGSGKWGFIDKTGKEVVTPKYTITDNFSEGLAMVNLYGNVGFIDKTGREVIPLKYNHGWSFSEGLAGVCLNGKWGYIDKNGKEVIDLKYDRVMGFNEGLSFVDLDGKWRLIDKSGKEVMDFWYSDGYGFSEGLATVASGTNFFTGGAGFIDKNGKEVIDLKYDGAFSFSEGLAAVGLDEKWGFIDKNGEEVIDLKYDHIESFSEGFAAFGVGDYETAKWGFIDKTGKEVIPPKYDYAYKFREGLAVIRIGDRATGKWGAIDKTGREVIPIKYDEVIGFFEGLAAVQLNGKWGLMKNPLLKEKDLSSNKPVKNRFAAKYSNVKLSIDGVAANGMEIYNIGDNNYFKLRDVAKLLNDTDKKFSVGWNNEKKLISLVSGENYVVAGGELTGGDGVDKLATLSTAKMELNSKEVNLKAYTIAGNNYFKLRDLCEILGVKVDWDQATQTILLKTK